MERAPPWRDSPRRSRFGRGEQPLGGGEFGDGRPPRIVPVLSLRIRLARNRGLSRCVRRNLKRGFGGARRSFCERSVPVSGHSERRLAPPTRFRPLPCPHAEYFQQGKVTEIQTAQFGTSSARTVPFVYLAAHTPRTPPLQFQRR